MGRPSLCTFIPCIYEAVDMAMAACFSVCWPTSARLLQNAGKRGKVFRHPSPNFKLFQRRGSGFSLKRQSVILLTPVSVHQLLLLPYYPKNTKYTIREVYTTRVMKRISLSLCQDGRRLYTAMRFCRNSKRGLSLFISTLFISCKPLSSQALLSTALYSWLLSSEHLFRVKSDVESLKSDAPLFCGLL